MIVDYTIKLDTHTHALQVYTHIAYMTVDSIVPILYMSVFSKIPMYFLIHDDLAEWSFEACEIH